MVGCLPSAELIDTRQKEGALSSVVDDSLHSTNNLALGKCLPSVRSFPCVSSNTLGKLCFYRVFDPLHSVNTLALGKLQDSASAGTGHLPAAHRAVPTRPPRAQALHCIALETSG